MALKLNTEKFKLIGGNKSVDFVNTVSGRSRNPFKKAKRDYQDFYQSDKLESYADLLAWSLKARLLEEKEARQILQLAEKESRDAEKVLKRALILRESIYRLFKSAIAGWQPDAEDLEKLNRELSIARAHQKLAAAKNGFAFEWIDRENALDAMLWQITESAADLLAAGDLSRLQYCGNETCNWLFIDTSRNRSRQWCDMKDCGNLAKVRRFRAKQQIPE